MTFQQRPEKALSTKLNAMLLANKQGFKFDSVEFDPLGYQYGYFTIKYPADQAYANYFFINSQTQKIAHLIKYRYGIRMEEKRFDQRLGLGLLSNFSNIRS